jgi:hypothetical protein
MTVRFRCGCVGKIEGTEDTCPVHGQRIEQAIKPRRPMFRGTASGPCCRTEDVAPVVVSLAEAPLVLKPREQDARHG